MRRRRQRRARLAGVRGGPRRPVQERRRARCRLVVPCRDIQLADLAGLAQRRHVRPRRRLRARRRRGRDGRRVRRRVRRRRGLRLLGYMLVIEANDFL